MREIVADEHKIVSVKSIENSNLTLITFAVHELRSIRENHEIKKPAKISWITVTNSSQAS